MRCLFLRVLSISQVRNMFKKSDRDRIVSNNGRRTFIRVCIRWLQKASIENQSPIFQNHGRYENPILINQIVGAKGPTIESARRNIFTAKCHSWRSIMPKSWLKANSPMESKANQYMTSLITTGFLAAADADMFFMRTPICRFILSLYNEMARHQGQPDASLEAENEGRFIFSTERTLSAESTAPEVASCVVDSLISREHQREIRQQKVVKV